MRMLKAQGKGRIGSPRALLFTIARNLARDALRKHKVIAFESLEECDHATLPAEEGNGFGSMSKQQELALLVEAVQTLPERCRQVVTLRMVYGLPQREIARQLDISENTVEKHMALGIRRCTEFFAQRGITSSS